MTNSDWKQMQIVAIGEAAIRLDNAKVARAFLKLKLENTMLAYRAASNDIDKVSIAPNSYVRDGRLVCEWERAKPINLLNETELVSLMLEINEAEKHIADAVESIRSLGITAFE